MRLLLAFKAFFETLNGKKEEKPEKIPSVENPSLRLLALLQKEGRLVDFFKEDISGYTDAQIGGAVRKIHADCGKCLEEFVTIRPLYQENEGVTVTVPQGYDPSVVKVVGRIAGTPPYQGILRHKGWKAHKLTLPKQMAPSDPAVISPAEIEVVS